MSFTVIVVIHDSAGHLPALFDSIAAYLAPSPQVLVVDSGSSDDGSAMARERGAEVLVLEGNPGFGAANNAGLEGARHPVTVLLNPDCELPDGGLGALAEAAAGREALLVPRLLNSDGTAQDSAHPLPGGWAGIARALLPGRVLPRPVAEQIQPWRSAKPRRVGWAIAACIAARTSLLRRLGPFDPSAFLFYEDMDLCLRARAEGVPTELRPEAGVVHHGGHATRPAFGGEPFGLEARRRREVVAARLGTRALILDDAAQALTFGIRAAAGRERERNLAALRALRAARRGGV